LVFKPLSHNFVIALLTQLETPQVCISALSYLLLPAHGSLQSDDPRIPSRLFISQVFCQQQGLFINQRLYGLFVSNSDCWNLNLVWKYPFKPLINWN
jgi:hypothetical protein